GDEATLLIYQKWLQHTWDITHELSVDRFVFYTEIESDEDLWSKGGYVKMIQEAGDLGHRMRSAFETLFQMGYEEVVIIGSDCYELTPAIIKEAYQLLQHYELTIGPATDGGYYLLGMKKELKEVFSGIEWSTEKVLDQTLKLMETKRYSYTLLHQLNDVDTIDDVPEIWKQELSIIIS
ncbi:MAG TPA: TIGR04282 family arsenosugar biosynthesis glycosyltransferase, partial [Flavisolibacter sp.]|nr:TIGR04282 family arsenosugar biosynthesis glycosyltransferase [Flavisolibacter sp.]